MSGDRELRPETGPAQAWDGPAWITDKLIELTLRVWQPYYRHPLTRPEAVDILLRVGQLFRVVSQRTG